MKSILKNFKASKKWVANQILMKDKKSQEEVFHHIFQTEKDPSLYLRKIMITNQRDKMIINKDKRIHIVKKIESNIHQGLKDTQARGL